MRSFQAPESFVIKSEKFFDFFQFFFLNAGVDVIETKDALFSLARLASLAPFFQGEIIFQSELSLLLFEWHFHPREPERKLHSSRHFD